jgi:hypothetical protein
MLYLRVTLWDTQELQRGERIAANQTANLSFPPQGRL